MNRVTIVDLERPDNDDSESPTFSKSKHIDPAATQQPVVSLLIEEEKE